MPKASTCIVVLMLLLVSVTPTVHAAPASGVVTRYPVPGSPYRLAMEAPGRVWATLPAQNAIASVAVSSSGAYEVAIYALPTANSEPYDIAFGAGAVWVTERLGNKIARFDPATQSWTEYPAPTAASQPTGLVVLAGSPVQVWFAERSGNKLGQLAVAGDLTGAVAEFPLPAGTEFAQAEMEDVAAVSDDAVWFTLPGAGLIGRFSLPLWGSSQAFYFLNPRNYPWLFPGKILRPWQVKLDGRGLPWFSEPGTDHIMRYNPNTIATFEHYPIASTGGGVDGLWITNVNAAADQFTAWYTARTANKIGQLKRVNYMNSARELPLGGAAPTDIAVDADTCAWVAAGGTNHVARWCPPYFQPTYLPMISRW